MIAAVLMTTAFALAGSEEKIVEDLINERTTTLNSYYDGGMQREEAREKIREIETGNLMEQDLENIDLYFQTDIDRIKEFELLSVNRIVRRYDMRRRIYKMGRRNSDRKRFLHVRLQRHMR